MWGASSWGGRGDDGDEGIVLEIILIVARTYSF